MTETTSRQTNGKPVSEVMSSRVLTLTADQRVDEAVSAIVDNRVTSMPVVDAAGHCIGVVSESDLLGRRGATVGDIMTRDVVTVDVDADLEAAAEIFLTRRIRRLPVVREGRLVGVLTRADLLQHVRETHWVCEWCGTRESGVRPPNACPSCGGVSWQLIAERR